MNLGFLISKAPDLLHSLWQVQHQWVGLKLDDLILSDSE